MVCVLFLVTATGCITSKPNAAADAVYEKLAAAIQTRNRLDASHIRGYLDSFSLELIANMELFKLHDRYPPPHSQQATGLLHFLE